MTIDCVGLFDDITANPPIVLNWQKHLCAMGWDIPYLICAEELI